MGRALAMANRRTVLKSRHPLAVLPAGSR